jgi:hypothetical protein
MRKIGKFISTILVIIGFVGFLSGSYFYGENVEIPLGDINGFVVDKDHNIYIGCAFYERVQVYNNEGEFIKNWPIEAYGGMFYMSKTEKDEILITTARGDDQTLYNKNGKILSKKNIDHQTFMESENDWKTFTTDNGIEYIIKGSLIQKIVKLNPEKTIINQNILLQLIKGPFNVWLLAVVGGVIGFFSKKENTENISSFLKSGNHKFWKKK